MLEIIDHGQVREIQIARPPVNALNLELVTLLTQSIRSAQSECRAVVLSGRQGVFCAGLDVVDLIRLDRTEMTNFWSIFLELLKTIACSEIPVAVAITGHSPAGGALMSIMGDYRVMCRGKYLIGLNETRVGLIIPPALHSIMAALVGLRAAESMLVSGALINPEDALKSGLIDALEDNTGSTIQHAIGWCEEMLSLPSHSMLGNRAVARRHFHLDFVSDKADNVKLLTDAWFSDETQIILNAMVDKLKSKK